MTSEEKQSENLNVVKVQRQSHADLETRVQDWLNRNIAEYASAKVKSLSVPSAGGLSGETIIVHIDETSGKPSVWHTLVIRKEVVDMVTNPYVNFKHLLRVQGVLGSEAGIPVPRILGEEKSPDILGAPFFIMEFAEGRIPADVPPYTSAGWVFDATAAQRGQMWQSGIDALVKIHGVDWQKHQLADVQLDYPGSSDIERCLNQGIAMFRQESKGYSSATCEEAVLWLQQHCPEPEARSLCWGDARIGNIIWQGFDCAAVIDWDMSFLGAPGIDLGWWSFFHRWSTFGLGFPDMDGAQVGQGLADLYIERGGCQVRNMHYYEVLATFRGLSIWLSTFHSMKAQGAAPDISPIDDSVHIVRLLKKLLTESY